MPDPAFIDLQYRFSAHLRDPAHYAAPAGIEERRLQIYRDLLYRNVEGFMAHAFPVLRSLTPDEHWHRMVRDYYARHRAQTPLFPRMAREFLDYLAHTRDDAADPPFLRELAHYEWLEAEALLDPAELADVAVDRECRLLDGAAVPNPTVRPARYRFPVHRIGPALQPRVAPPQPTYLVVFRRRDDTVGFMELNAVAARLLELILQQAVSASPSRALLQTIAAELAHPQPEIVVDGGREILETFLHKDVILGTR